VSQGGILVDTQLWVLYIVGSVNPERVGQFKRTRSYSLPDYYLLRSILRVHRRIYTVPHVMAEVGNLCDLAGAEGVLARKLLREVIRISAEVA
jgi:hypothetical protein